MRNESSNKSNFDIEVSLLQVGFQNGNVANLDFV